MGKTKFVVPGFPMYGDCVVPFDTEFCGNSLICDHTGSLLAMADGHSNAALFCTCSTQYSQQMKQIDFENYGSHQIAKALLMEDSI